MSDDRIIARGRENTFGELLTDTAPLRKAGALGRIAGYFQRHAQVFLATLGQFARAPISNLIVIMIIGISLALPAALYVGLENVRQLAAGWDDEARISLFLKRSVSAQQARGLVEDLRRFGGVKSIRYISPEEGLRGFREQSGLTDVLGLLKENPLPAVLVVLPQDRSPAAAEALLSRLRSVPEVEIAQLDLEWLQRLHALMALGERALWVVAGLLAAAVLFIVGNTIRAVVQLRRDEIVISKLVGATDIFIRRPFLYLGGLQGFFGGVLAWLLVIGGLALLQGPVARLAALYQSGFELTGPGLMVSLGMVLSAMLLGWVGAFLSVSYHLREIRPT